MDGNLMCNFTKCRKRLSTEAWVTSCSHIFCNEDAMREFNKSHSCPACETDLTGSFDIIKIDLQQSDKYKSMVLAGQNPETIMEICSRALAFWTYQTHQERTYQEHMTKKAKERTAQLKHYYEQVVSRTNAELASIKTQLAACKEDLGSTKKKYSMISKQIMEKARQYQKLQMMYDALRRKCITPATFDNQEIPKAQTPCGNIRNAMSIKHDEFVLQPMTTPDRLRQNQNRTPLHNIFDLNCGEMHMTEKTLHRA